MRLRGVQNVFFLFRSCFFFFFFFLLLFQGAPPLTHTREGKEKKFLVYEGGTCSMQQISSYLLQLRQQHLFFPSTFGMPEEGKKKSRIILPSFLPFFLLRTSGTSLLLSWSDGERVTRSSSSIEVCVCVRERESFLLLPASIAVL